MTAPVALPHPCSRCSWYEHDYQLRPNLDSILDGDPFGQHPGMSALARVTKEQCTKASWAAFLTGTQPRSLGLDSVRHVGLLRLDLPPT
jgi:hypothetical protein